MQGTTEQYPSVRSICLCLATISMTIALFMLPIAAEAAWTGVGPAAKVIKAVAVAPDNPLVRFAGSFGSGVFKSIDGGVTWKESNTGLLNGYVRCLLPLNSMEVLAGTNDGVFRSLDGCATWTMMLPLTVSVRALARDRLTGRIYAGSYGSGLYSSADTGVTWTAITVRDTLAKTGLTHLRAVAVYGRDSVYVGGSLKDVATGGALFVSHNGGINWTQVQPAKSIRSSIEDIAISPNSPDSSLIVATAALGVHKSTNGGVNWLSINGPTTLHPLPDTQTSVVVFTRTHRMVGTDSLGGFYRRALGDTTQGWFPSTGLPPMPSHPTDAWVDTGGSELLLGTDGQGVYRSADSGVTFSPRNTGMMGTAIRGILFANAGRMIAATGFGDKIWYTGDGGVTWSQSTVPTSNSVVGLSKTAIATVIYAGTYGSGVIKSIDNGQTWTLTDTIGINKLVRAVAIPTGSTTTIYAATNNGVYKSDNGAALFARKPGSGADTIPTGKAIHSLAISPFDTSIVLAGTDSAFMYRSINSGGSWTHLGTANGFAAHDMFVRCFEFDPTVAGKVYAGSDSGHVYVSTDNGANWTPLAGLITVNSVRALRVDPAHASRLFAATFGGGVFASENSGVTWANISGSLPDSDLFTLEMDPAGPATNLYLGSGHTGLYKGPYTPLTGVTIQSTPPGRTITVDGVSYSTPQSFGWVAGSVHTIATTTPQTGGVGVQHTWTGWSDGGALSHTIAPAKDTLITANFLTQYTLTTQVSPAAGGSIVPSGGWYNSGQSVVMTASPAAGYSFLSWAGNGTGSYTGLTNPVTITMNGPITQTANFSSAQTIQVTLQSSPSGRQVQVDGGTYSTPQIFSWQPGSLHTLATTSPQSGGAGVQYVWSNWSDGGAISHTVTPSANITYTVNFTSQFYLTMQNSPAAGGTSVPASGWYNSGQSTQITATPAAGYLFSGWTGTGTGSYTGATSPATVIMNSPITEVAAFSLITVRVTVQSSPVGRSLSVDGTSYTAPQTFNWIPGATHTVATTSPQAGTPGTQYVWSNWSDAGAMSHTIAPTRDSTFTVNFLTQYSLTTQASPAAGGSVSPPSGGWYNSGQTVSVSATVAASYTFQGWSGSGTGSYNGPANPASVTMNGPVIQTANFAGVQTVSITVQSSPAGRLIQVDGGLYIAPQSFSWVSGSTHSLATTSPQSGGTGVQYVWSSWSDGGAASHNVAPATAVTYTVNFTTQFYLTMQNSPGAGGTSTPASGWFNSGQSVQLTATPAARYVLQGWTGTGTGSYTGGGSPASITMNAPITETANFALAAINVTVQTSPAGQGITVDGTNYTAPQVFSWNPGSAHTVATSSPQSPSAGTQYVWSTWSDLGAMSHSVSPATDTTLTANFITQFSLTTQVSPGGAGTVAPSGGWYNSGQSVSLTATASGGFTFLNWAGGGSGSYTGLANPASITMNGPVSQTANFYSPNTVLATVQSSPEGRIVQIDGTSYYTPQTLSWISGSNHSVAVQTPQTDQPGARYTWTGWSDGGAMSHSIAPAASALYSATFSTEFRLATGVNPPSTGTVTPATSWYAPGVSVPIKATAGLGFLFHGWTGTGPGSYTGMSASASAIINGPVTQTAQFILNTPPVLAHIGDKSVLPGQVLHFTVTATDAETPSPSLTATGVPLNATFVDNGNGTGTFDFHPTLAQIGFFYVTFVASDGMMTTQEPIQIRVIDPSCDCSHAGDGNGDGVVDVFDVIMAIQAAFSGGPSPIDPNCYAERLDFDCNGNVDVFDVINLIAYAFSSGPPPCNACM